jgi:hypothetical protein
MMSRSSTNAVVMHRELIRNAIRDGIAALSTPLERDTWLRFCEVAKTSRDARLLPELLVRILDAGHKTDR